ncbi:LysR family transcriptional regulator [Paenibacillus cymbidii]|uniref:LysR family transcriptional regulator n=1 Tax=Paenibacillus cymbidii TaxID=1639034 RepID=UPI001080F31D|nr:LysR family transcriptional regulator [Paenibacillus cymbidii]
MQIEQLRYLVEIARSGSVSAAARNLHVSQSAISKSLLRFEDHLGSPLFIRLQSGVTPTETGKRIIAKADEILEQLQEFDEWIEECKGAASNKISLACVPLFTPILSESLELLMQNNPKLQIDITEKKSKEIMQDVMQHVIHVGFMVVNPNLTKEPDLKCNVLLESNMYVCVNKRNLLADREQLYPEDLLNLSLISYNCNMVDWLNYYFNDDSFQYSVVTNNLDYIKRKVAQDAAISIIPELVIRNHNFLENGNIAAVKLMLNDQPFKMQVASVRLKKYALPRIVRDLLQNMKAPDPSGSGASVLAPL